MNDIIKKGGDVHANASIVGGLLGASVGVEGVGRERIAKVLYSIDESRKEDHS